MLMSKSRQDPEVRNQLQRSYALWEALEIQKCGSRGRARRKWRAIQRREIRQKKRALRRAERKARGHARTTRLLTDEERRTPNPELMRVERNARRNRRQKLARRR